VSPSAIDLRVGSTLRLTATVEGEAGEILSHRVISWSSSAPGTVAVNGEGVVTGIGPGAAVITATSEGISGEATATIPPLGPPASVTVSPATVRLENRGPEQASFILSAKVEDEAGNQLSIPVEWASSDPAIVAVSPAGLLTAKLYGDATITASAAGHRSTSAVTVVLLYGTPVPVPVGGGHSFTDLRASGFNTCGLDDGGSLHCWGNLPPPVPASGPRFTSLASGGSLGGTHLCALAGTGEAYCWGDNSYGQLGTGSTSSSAQPQPVAGDLRFTQISTGQSHTCGLAEEGRAYCWGLNFAGELGTGQPSGEQAISASPQPVAGQLGFTTIGTGDDHTCGLTAAGRAYCWGENDNGEVGDGTRENRLAPIAVAGSLTFKALAVGGEHTCGLATNGSVYCWGWDNRGAYTTGPNDRLRPTLLGGGLTFSAIAAGGSHDCALTAAGAAYCWGAGFFGQLGDRSGADRLMPEPVFGDLEFTRITLGGYHSCALRSTGEAFCWGHDENGELGTELP
jgi:alpha-tubulin suppressor-like RCC1 family protein